MPTNYLSQVNEAKKSLDFENFNYSAEILTNKGPIRLEFFPEDAPGHVQNFLALAKIGFYNGLGFHRIIKDFVIQGGCPMGSGMGDAGYKIKAEFNSRPHEPGVLSMARATEPDSAGSQFFLCLGRVPHLDRQYTVFGKTADQASLDTVLAFGKIRTGPNDKPLEEAKMISVTVHDSPKSD